MSSIQDIAGEAAKAAPPIAVVSATFCGYSLSELVVRLTLLYLVLQIAFIMRKHWYLWRDRCDAKLQAVDDRDG